ncbi:unnamed protein product [Miscanthus lutarioriparius]|uniref:Uncharacterized protein n=1 Tax=Miscanthus lutarioriparius TaxID=422564 RepID=A0A811QB26_9POAL|nr:unnamed protein product [Miscanthus lutarioriparius]
MVAGGSPRTLLPVQKLPTRRQFLFHRHNHLSVSSSLSEMEKKEKEKSEEPWVGRRILGIAAAGAVAVAAGAFLLLSSVGDDEQAADDTTARPRKTMKGPGSGGEHISRDKFEKDAANYFRTGRQKGPKAAVDEFQ